MNIQNEKSKTTPDRNDRKDKITKIKTPKEIGGRQGPEPTRYGDWEKDGIASDF